METLTLPNLRRAIETRDGATLAGFYTDDALLRIIDQNHPPSHPMEISRRATPSPPITTMCVAEP